MKIEIVGDVHNKHILLTLDSGYSEQIFPMKGEALIKELRAAINTCQSPINQPKKQLGDY